MGFTKRRVAVALSGGVDSSVAAALLVEQGYNVVGLTMKLFDHRSSGNAAQNLRGCCNWDAIARAQAVCKKLDIPHYAIDLMDQFEHYVIEDFISEYIEGRTPNPCVRCNTFLKWGELFKRAQALGCDDLATGHYARVLSAAQASDSGAAEFHLLRARDRNKDQAYALWGIPRQLLPHTLFPLGELNKPQVRELASRLGLKTAETPESQEICFIPEGKYTAFLRERKPEVFARLAPGEIWEENDAKSRYVRSHTGYPDYTIGQRRGLGGGFTEPRFVIRIEPESNRVIIGERQLLLSLKLAADQVNWLIPTPTSELRVEVQIRYRSSAGSATLHPLDNEQVRIVFDQSVEAATPGQSVVFFQGERLLGGGRIIFAD